ncbi:hypothetical protein pb186bvf_013078 [Paramecium bursaria]
MRPKCNQNWNDAQTQIKILIKHNSELEVKQEVMNGKKVEIGQTIASYQFEQQQRNIKAQIEGIIVWSQPGQQYLYDQIDSFQQIGVIYKNEVDASAILDDHKQLQEELSITSSHPSPQLVKLNFLDLCNESRHQIRVKKWKIKVGDLILTNQFIGSVYDDDEPLELVSQIYGLVEFLAEVEKDYTQTDILMTVIPKDKICKHIRIEKGFCVYCNEKIIQQKENQFPDAILDDDTAKKISIDLVNNIINVKKKLIMVLDLDQTILHAIKIFGEFQQSNFISTINSQQNGPFNTFKQLSQNIEEFYLELNCDKESKFIIKLRPYFEQFFVNLIPLYEIYIYTKASRGYAEFILNNISKSLYQVIPEQFPYFHKNRIISRDDTVVQNQKSLDRIFFPGVADKYMVILDDNQLMWTQFRDNLVYTRPFNYFKEGTGGKDVQGIALDIEKNVQIINFHDFWLLSATKALMNISQQFWQQVQESKNGNNILEYEQDLPNQKKIQLDNEVVSNYNIQDVNIIINNNISVIQIHQQVKRQILNGYVVYFAIAKKYPKKIIEDLESCKQKIVSMGGTYVVDFKALDYSLPNRLLITYQRPQIESIKQAIEKQVPIVHYKWIDDCESYMLALDYNLYTDEQKDYNDEQLRDSFLKPLCFDLYKNL